MPSLFETILERNTEMWYVVMNDVKIPIPYLTLQDAIEAMNKLRAENGPSIFDIVRED